MATLTLQDIGACNCTTTCSYTFTVQGCNSLAYAGVTVSVYDVMGGTLLDTDTTDGSGHATLTWSGTSGTYYVTVTGISTRFNAYGQNLTIGCGSGTTITLSAATGYVCFPGCLLPVATTLSLTDSAILGGPVTATLTYSAGTWSGTASLTYPGTRCSGIACVGATITLTYSLTSASSITVSYQSGGLFNACPVTTGTGTAHNTTVGGSLIACPGAFELKYTALNGCGSPLTDAPGYSLYSCPATCLINNIDVTE
jgi:hypothetical protein